MEKYKDSRLPVEKRVEDLLSRMTLKEKVGQLNQRMKGWNTYKKTSDNFKLTSEFKKEVQFGDGMGALYGLFRADPWSGITFKNGIPVEQCAKVANMIQKYVIKNTRLGIPVLICEECPHGHQALYSTVFPTNLGAASTWNPQLNQKVYSCVAQEVRARGGNVGLVSTLDILREPRWGRSEECFGEDPYLASKMTEAVVKGLQGDNLNELKGCKKIAAVLKHFCAQGACTGGINAAPALIGERELHEIFLPPMEYGVRTGAQGCMAAYNEIDGIPCNANSKLLTKLLRDKWGFEGIVMADGEAVDRLTAITGDYESAGILALTSGVDISLWDTAFTKLEQAVLDGKISESYINKAVRRVLRLKFMLGLFDNPYTDEKKAFNVVGCKEFKKVNLKAARESMVLLKNKDNILPLKSNLKKIAVIGPNADNLYNQLGDYTAPQQEQTGVTVLQGIKNIVSKGTDVIYVKGCGIRDTSKQEFDRAVQAAKQSDVTILVLGGSSARNFDMEFDTNGAAVVTDTIYEMDCGEGFDTADLTLGGVQVELAKEIIKLGKPVITVLIQGRPHAVPWIAENCDALLCSWYPGKEGGTAVAEILFGKVNPSGKLPVSIPRSSSQLPVYYNYKNMGCELDYCDMIKKPLFTFGYGLSYTSFEFSNLKIKDSRVSLANLESGKNVCIYIDIKNTGKVGGAQVVQLYIQDMQASITRRIKELKGFEKVWLKPGESKTVCFSLGKNELGIWNADMKFMIEPGQVKIMAGGSSITDLSEYLTII